MGVLCLVLCWCNLFVCFVACSLLSFCLRWSVSFVGVGFGWVVLSMLLWVGGVGVFFFFFWVLSGVALSARLCFPGLLMCPVWGCFALVWFLGLAARFLSVCLVAFGPA